MRNNDNPKYKEIICSEIFGRFVEKVKSSGFIKGQEYETKTRETFDVSTKILWLDEVNEFNQITIAIRSLDCSVEYGVVDKKTSKVIHREKIENLRYKISSGTNIELTSTANEKLELLFNNFDNWFNKLKLGKI